MLQGVDRITQSRYGRESWVRKTGSAPFGLTWIVGLTLSVVLVTVLFWAAAAEAQTPADVQYKERVTTSEVSSEPADPADEAKGGGDGTSQSAGDPADRSYLAGPAGEAKAGDKSPLTAPPEAGTGGKSSLTARPKVGILPATGGPMLLIFVGALVTSGVGLVLLSRSNRGR